MPKESAKTAAVVEGKALVGGGDPRDQQILELADEVSRLKRELATARKAFELQALHFALPKDDHRRKSIISLDKPKEDKEDLIPKVAALEEENGKLKRQLENARKGFELQAMHYALPADDHRRKSIVTLDKDKLKVLRATEGGARASDDAIFTSCLAPDPGAAADLDEPYEEYDDMAVAVDDSNADNNSYFCGTLG